MKRNVLLALVLLALSGASLAQQALNNAAIMKMHSAGLGDDVIVQTVTSKPGDYSVGVDDLIALKSAGISDKVISAMIAKANTSKQPSSTTSPTKTAPESRTSEWPLAYITTAVFGNIEGSMDYSSYVSEKMKQSCPFIHTTLSPQAADYTIHLLYNGEHGFLPKNQIQVIDRSGNVLVQSKVEKTVKAAILDICKQTTDDWMIKHGANRTEQ